MVEENNSIIPPYRAYFEIGKLPIGRGLQIFQVESGLNNAKTALYGYITENSCKIAQSVHDGVLDITGLTPDNIAIRYLALHTPGPCPDVYDLRLELTSFSTQVDSLSEKLKDVARKAATKDGSLDLLRIRSIEERVIL